MLDWTDRHQRFFARSMSQQARLYTEMVTTGALLYGDPHRHLDFSVEEKPVALQLGGADPAALADSAQLGADWGYDEINLNVGCPSDRVQNGAFGACLMAEPKRVAAAVKAMRDAVALPVTVKCRLGIDDSDIERDFDAFIDRVADEGGCQVFIVHARKAWLRGLSPKENRTIPPLNYERVARLKARRPELTIVLNGGLQDSAACQEALSWADGVMLGRAAYQQPQQLLAVDSELFGAAPQEADAHAIAELMAQYAEREIAKGTRLHSITRHLLGLFNGRPNARVWRRMLAEESRHNEAGLIRLAASQVPRHAPPQDNKSAA